MTMRSPIFKLESYLMASRLTKQNRISAPLNPSLIKDLLEKVLLTQFFVITLIVNLYHLEKFNISLDFYLLWDYFFFPGRH